MRSNPTFRILRKLIPLALLAFALAASGAALCQEGPFNRFMEFPNYFLPKKFRAMSPEELQHLSKEDQAELDTYLAKIQPLAEKALGNILDHIELPVVTEPGQPPKMTAYFPFIEGVLSKEVPGSMAMPSAGVMRAVWAYLYGEVYAASFPHETISVEKVLSDLGSSDAKIPAIKVRGVGSDFDLVVQVRTPEDFEKARIIVKRYAGSAWNTLGKTTLSREMQQALYTVPDVQSYAGQIELAVRQGGSSVDVLAYDLKNHHVVEPPEAKGIIRGLLMGLVDYVEPRDPTAPVTVDKQAIRGVRPLLEIPYVHYRNEKRIKDELKQMLADLKAGKQLSEKALEQFPKMVRNSMFSGGDNRVYRAPEDSVEGLILAISQEAAKLGHLPPLIPRFTDRHPLELRDPVAKTELNGLSRDLLMTTAAFRSNIAPGGLLRHGTRSIPNGLAIMRQNLILSMAGQGTAAYGRGAYASPDLGFAQGFAGNAGLVFDITVPDDPRINILDWQSPKTQADPLIQALKRKYGDDLDKVFEELSNKHGIDIIINEHVLIQNAEATSMARTIGSIVNAYARTVNHPEKLLSARIQALKEYARLYAYAIAAGESDVLQPQNLADVVTQALQELSRPGSPIPDDDRSQTLDELMDIEGKTPRTAIVLRRIASDRAQKPAIRECALKWMGEDSKPQTADVQTLKAIASAEPNLEVREKAIGSLVEVAKTPAPGAPTKAELVDLCMAHWPTRSGVDPPWPLLVALRDLLDAPGWSVADADRLRFLARRLEMDVAGPPPPKYSLRSGTLQALRMVWDLEASLGIPQKEHGLDLDAVQDAEIYHFDHGPRSPAAVTDDQESALSQRLEYIVSLDPTSPHCLAFLRSVALDPTRFPESERLAILNAYNGVPGVNQVLVEVASHDPSFKVRKRAIVGFAGAHKKGGDGTTTIRELVNSALELQTGDKLDADALELIVLLRSFGYLPKLPPSVAKRVRPGNPDADAIRFQIGLSHPFFDLGETLAENPESAKASEFPFNHGYDGRENSTKDFGEVIEKAYQLGLTRENLKAYLEVMAQAPGTTPPPNAAYSVLSYYPELRPTPGELLKASPAMQSIVLNVVAASVRRREPPQILASERQLLETASQASDPHLRADGIFGRLLISRETPLALLKPRPEEIAWLDRWAAGQFRQRSSSQSRDHATRGHEFVQENMRWLADAPELRETRQAWLDAACKDAREAETLVFFIFSRGEFSPADPFLAEVIATTKRFPALREGFVKQGFRYPLPLSGHPDAEVLAETRRLARVAALDPVLFKDMLRRTAVEERSLFDQAVKSSSAEIRALYQPVYQELAAEFCDLKGLEGAVHPH